MVEAYFLHLLYILHGLVVAVVDVGVGAIAASILSRDLSWQSIEMKENLIKLATSFA